MTTWADALAAQIEAYRGVKHYIAADTNDKDRMRHGVLSTVMTHADVYAWNAKERPGRPIGGDPQTVRALYKLIRQRFG